MLIQGTIQSVAPPDYQDNYQNHYQNIVVDTASGPIQGRKASKQAYGPNDVGRQVEWECEAKSNSRGPYNKFTKPQDPQYQNQQQGSPQPQQGYQQAAPQPNGKDIIITRLAVLKGVLSATDVPLDMVDAYLTAGFNYAKTGQWRLGPNSLPAGPPEQDDIPY